MNESRIPLMERLGGRPLIAAFGLILTVMAALILYTVLLPEGNGSSLSQIDPGILMPEQPTNTDASRIGLGIGILVAGLGLFVVGVRQPK